MPEWLPLRCLVTTCLTALILLILLGLSPAQAAWVTIALFGAAISGLSLASGFLRPGTNSLESMALALPLGVLLQSLAFLVLRPEFSARIIFAFTLLLSLAPQSFRRCRSRAVLTKTPREAPTGAIVVLGMVTGSVGALSFWLRHRLDWSGPLDMHDDIVYHEALAGAAQNGWPVRSPLLGRESLSYHWLPNLWAAFVDSVADLPPFAAITRVVPLLAIFGAVVAAAAWAKRLSRQRLAAPIAAVGITTVGTIALGPQSGLPLPLESPSELFGTMFMLAVCLTVWIFRQGDLSAKAYGALLLFGFFALSAAKLSQAVVTLSAVGALVLGSRIRGRSNVAAGPHILGLVGFALGFFVFHFHGDRHDLAFHPLESLSAGLDAVLVLSPTIARALLTVSAVAGPLLVSLVILRKRPETCLFVAGALSCGIFLALSTTSPGGSEGYFLSAALKIVIVVASAGFATVLGDTRAVLRLQPRWPALTAMIGLGCTTTATATYFVDAGVLSTTAFRLSLLLAGAVLIGRALSSALSWSMFAAGLFVVASLSTLVGSLALAAGNVRLESADHALDAVRSEAFAIGAELHGASESDDLLVTNRFCRNAREAWPGCNTKWFEASAASGRRSLIEGIDYAVGADQPQEILRLVELSELAAGTADPVALAEVYALGVRWIWFDRLIGQQPDWGQFGDVRLSNDTIVVIELSPTLATQVSGRGR